MRIIRFLSIISALIFLHCSLARADEPQLYRIETSDGVTVIGAIEEQDSLRVVMRTLSGARMEFPRWNIIGIEKVYGSVRDGKLYRQDPNYSRLFLGATGRPLRPGEGYLSDYWIFFPFVGYGLGGGVTAAGGISLFPGTTSQIFYLAPKFTFLQKERQNLAVGLLHIGVTGVDDNGGIGIAYVVGTFGNPQASLTTGLGWGYAVGDLSDRPILMAGGDYQIGRGSKLLFEWWFPPEGDFSLLGFGTRFFGERLSWDFAFLSPIGVGMEGFPFLPWVGVSYSFGGRRE